MARNLSITVVLVLSLPDGMSDQEAFARLNKDVNPFGVDFIYPANTLRDQPVVLARVVKLDDILKT